MTRFASLIAATMIFAAGFMPVAAQAAKIIC
jgi:hypothetical protein